VRSRKRVGNNNRGLVLAYPFQITDLRPVRRRSATRRRGGKRSFPGVKVIMMDFQVQALRACAEALGWRFDAFLKHALLQAKWETERLFGMSHGDLVLLSKGDRAKLASHYQAVCEAGRKAKLSDYYHPDRPVPTRGEPLAWAVRDGHPIDSN
jgi:hypothetical protein